MRYYVFILCVLGGFVLNTCAGLAVSPKIKVKEITVRVENSSVVYPDSVVLLSGDLSEAQRRQLFNQLRHDVLDNQLMPGDPLEAVESVLRAASLVLKADNVTASGVDKSTHDKRDDPSMHVYVVESNKSNRRSRKRRSARLVRSAYSKQWQDLCDSCPALALAPQQPVIINIIKTGSGCGNDCTPPQNKITTCGHPQCESPFPPDPFMFHHPPPPHFHHHPPPPLPPPHFHHPPPPPPPPPHFYNYPPAPPMFQPQQPVFYMTSPPQQPVNITPRPMYQSPPQQPVRPQSTPPVNKCDPCASPGGQPQAPSSGGSFSQSSASAQSSSFAWNG